MDDLVITLNLEELGTQVLAIFNNGWFLLGMVIVQFLFWTRYLNKIEPFGEDFPTAIFICTLISLIPLGPIIFFVILKPLIFLLKRFLQVLAWWVTW